MAQNKTTQREFYEQFLELAVNDEQRNFCRTKIAQLDNKKSNKTMTAEQKLNEELKGLIVSEVLADGRIMTQGDITKELNAITVKEYSTQKVGALIKQLREMGVVQRTETKGVAYFSLV